MDFSKGGALVSNLLMRGTLSCLQVFWNQKNKNCYVVPNFGKFKTSIRPGMLCLGVPLKAELFSVTGSCTGWQWVKSSLSDKGQACHPEAYSVSLSQVTPKVWLGSMAGTPSTRCLATSVWWGFFVCTHCWGITTRPSRC